jgi:TetR/AcrR family transcriptional repressor of mexJK operon
MENWRTELSSVIMAGETGLEGGTPLPATLRETGEETRPARKRQAILAAAASAFLRSGYLGTSMDQIAADAAVSKQTIYKHFGGKERLFAEIVLTTIGQFAEPFYAALDRLPGPGDLEKELYGLARQLLDGVMDPTVLRLRRLIIGEAGRFPELGRTYYQQGPARTAAALATAFTRLTARGLLQTGDPATAASHFNWLTLATPLEEAMLTGNDHPRSPGDLDKHALAAVRAFLSAYRPH